MSGIVLAATLALVLVAIAAAGAVLAVAYPRRFHAALPVADHVLRPGYAVGMTVVYLLAGLALFGYVRRYSRPRGVMLRTQLGLFALVLFLAMLARVVWLVTPLPPYAVPVAAVPLWAGLYLGRRTALVFGPMLAFVVASVLGFDEAVIAVLLAQGLGATLSLRDRKHPWAMVPAGLLGGAVAALTLWAVAAVRTGVALPRELLGDDGRALLGCLGGGAGAGVLAWALHPVAGWALGGVPRGRLLDLADLDNPVLQKMAAEAPGSWEHSRAMANLAEAASAAIGADALLTRVGAYYHDLGKTVQPKYFVENLGPDERSPHEDLDPDVSADAIMVHVVQGAAILREAGVPEPVVEFAYTHHGTSVIEYFWHKCQQQGNPKALTQDSFRYPGMKPRSRETAILMLVDGIEAASRTIDPPSHDNFEQMIQRVVFTKIRQGQLAESGLSVEDLRVLAITLAQVLVNAHHHRIKYPWQGPGGDGNGGVTESQPGDGAVSPRELGAPTIPQARP